MIAVIQRVSSASVTVEGSIVAKIGRGFMILVCVGKDDIQTDADLLSAKIAKLRVFEDENGKMNKALDDVGGDCIVVSQFTLMADYSHGNRPSFFDAAPPDISKPMYEYFCSKLKAQFGGDVQTGVFGADMKCEINNDGPVTIVMDSLKLRKQ